MPKKKSVSTVLPPEYLARNIYLIRGQKVMLDTDLAALYGVPTKQLNLAVRRNHHRFPEDFMFKLTSQEVRNLRFQIETSSWGGSRYVPHAFTEHGVAMLSSVLRSERAVQMNILIIRAFVQLRELVASNKDLAARLEKLENRQEQHGSLIAILAQEIDALKAPQSLPRKRRIGYI
ncbi:MAG: ORF6N domain-containing protein [Pseudomonadota bacterium]|nr:ORF6N domain-containing protein [Pseudomonadota bacterium]